MGIGTFHANIEQGLSHKLKVRNVPAIVAIIDGKAKHYSGPISVAHLRSFVREIFPKHLLTTVRMRCCKHF